MSTPFHLILIAPTTESSACSRAFPSLLSQRLDRLLEPSDWACICTETIAGVGLLLKAPRHELEPLRPQTPTRLQTQLFELPQAPVLRTALTLTTAPDHALSFEAFWDVDVDEFRQFAQLAQQEELWATAYDEAHQHLLTLQLRPLNTIPMRLTFERAWQWRIGIPFGHYNFKAARTELTTALHR